MQRVGNTGKYGAELEKNYQLDFQTEPILFKTERIFFGHQHVWKKEACHFEANNPF